jgi:hypothetical protein
MRALGQLSTACGIRPHAVAGLDMTASGALVFDLAALAEAGRET